MYYRSLLLLAIQFYFSAYSWSQDSRATAELGFVSVYVDRGIQLGNNTLHPSIEMSRGDFYAGIWLALPVEDTGWPDNFENQYDAYLGYGWALDAKTSFDLGATLSRFSESASAFEPYVGISREMGTFTPALYIYDDLDGDAWTFEISTDIAIPLEVFPFETRIFAGTVDVSGAGDYDYFGADVVYPIELSDSTNLSLGLHYSDNDLGFGVAGDHLYGSASVAVSF